ncbi:MAG TPA: hypothetical protein VGK93_02045 [Candidatus Eisenbacteria bacterium]|jgi:hypothetical protein
MRGTAGISRLDMPRPERVRESGGAPKGEEAIAFTGDHPYDLPHDRLLQEDRTTMGVSVEGWVLCLDPLRVADCPSNGFSLPIDDRPSFERWWQGIASAPAGPLADAGRRLPAACA